MPRLVLPLGILLLSLLLFAGCGGGTMGASAPPAAPAAAAPFEAEAVRERSLGAGFATMERSLAQGRWLVFHTSEALVAGDLNGVHDVYLQDLQEGSYTLVSQGGNRASSYASISSDGNRIAYSSDATNLVAGDTNGRRDVFVWDRQAGTTVRASVTQAGAQSAGTSTLPALSADGRQVVFVSDGRLAAAKTTTAVDVFVRDLEQGTTSLLTPGLQGAGGNGASSSPAVSGDGRFVAFASAATNLVAGDTNGAADIFLLDRESGSVERVSVGAGGVQANGACAQPSLSDDGRYVAWDSIATTLVAGDTNGRRDVFLRDRTAGATTRPGTAVGGDTAQPSLSRAGTRLAFARAGEVVWLSMEDPTAAAPAAANSSPSDQPSWDSTGESLAFRTGSVTVATGASAARPLLAVVALPTRTVPARMAAPTATPGGVGSYPITVSWTAPAEEGITSYRVEASPAPPSSPALMVVSAPTTSVVYPNLDPATSYRFTVSAANDLGWSAPSPESAATTPDLVVVLSAASRETSTTAMALDEAGLFRWIGTLGGTVAWTNPVTSGRVTSSANVAGVNSLANLVDGAAPGWGPDSWGGTVTWDLGSQRRFTLSGFRISHKPASAGEELLVSTDNVNWTRLWLRSANAGAPSGFQSDYVDLSSNNVQARYVRYRHPGTDPRSYLWIDEVELYGALRVPAPPAEAAVPSVTYKGPGTRYVDLAWAASTELSATDVYRVVISPAPSMGAATRLVTATTRNLRIDALDPGVTYTFTVTARNDGGWGPSSAPSAPVTIDATPGSLAALDTSYNATVGNDGLIGWLGTNGGTTAFVSPAATGKITVTAATVGAGTTPAATVNRDGNYYNAGGYTGWIQWDLGSTRRLVLKGMRIPYQPGSAGDRIEVSANGSTWTTVYTRPSADTTYATGWNCPYFDTSANTVAARYIRFTHPANDGRSWFAADDTEFYGILTP